MAAKSRGMVIIKEIEEAIGTELSLMDVDELVDISNFFITKGGYSLDETGRVTGLRIDKPKTAPSALVGQLTGLNVLILRFCNLSDVSFLRDLKGLTSLDLSGNNNLSDVSFLRDLKGLTHLYLFNNNLSDVSFLRDLKGLTHLYLYNNNLGDVSFLRDLKGLAVLDLCNNNLSDVSFLEEMDNLRYVDLRDNPITEPPKEIIEEGIDAIRDYFKAIKGKTRPLKEVKILLVGDGGAGKTSLLKCLNDETFNKNEPQTHGINIAHKSIEITEGTANIHIWDFGGQDIMHASHQFFLSKRSLYILVTDCRKEDRLEHWLKHIRAFGADSPVMVVINKIDENPGFDVNRRDLLEKYPNIRDFYKLSCADRSGIDHFIQQLTAQIETVEYMRSQWPQKWFNIKQALETMEENYITDHHYYHICSHHRLTDQSQQKTLLEYLHNLGVILHFEDLELKDYQVLEPKWVTEAVYKIINSQRLADKKGYLDKSMVETILHDESFDKEEYHASLRNTRYTGQEQAYILSLMKTFELCYPVTGGTLLVPDLLDVQEPHYVTNFDNGDCLRFIYQLGYLPAAVIPRFIVRMHGDISAPHLQWRTGVVLADKKRGDHKTEALVKADKEAKRIEIRVKGPEKRDYFAVVNHAVERILGSYNKLEIARLVPLPDHPAITVEYDELKGYQAADRDDYFVGKLQKSYSVSQLLEGLDKKQPWVLTEHPDSREYHRGIPFHQTINVNVKAEAHSHASAQSLVHLEVDLPALQGGFDQLKALLAGLPPDQAAALGPRLEEVDRALYEAEPGDNQKELKRPLGKLGNFLRELGDKDSDYGRILEGSKKALKCAQEIGKVYNKFAQWIPGLPVVPDLLLGK